VNIYKSKTLRSIFGILLLFVVLSNAIMYALQPGMVFFPTKIISQTPNQWGLKYEDVYLESTDQNKIHGWYLPVKDSKQALLFFHGNGGNISHRGDSLKIFNRLGLNVLIIDYQGYGKSEGSPGEQEMYDDALAAWQYLRVEKNFKSNDIIIFGRSLGGTVAANLAADVNPRVLILESTFSSVKDMAKRMLPVISRIVYSRYQFNTAQKITKNRAPLLVLHSRDDDIIPFELGEKVYRAARKPKIFIEMVGDHNNGFMLSQPAYGQALDKFLKTKF